MDEFLHLYRHVEATTVVTAGLDEVVDALGQAAAVIVTGATDGRNGPVTQVRTSIGVDVPSGGGIHQEVVVAVGAVERDGATARLAVEWSPIALGRFVPSFEGDLELSALGRSTLLRLAGTYDVPLGTFGRFADGIVGRRIARRTIEGFLEDVARRLEIEVHGDHPDVPCPVPHTVDVVDVPVEEGTSDPARVPSTAGG